MKYLFKSFFFLFFFFFFFFFFSFFFFFFFLHFKATPTAYGSFQTRVESELQLPAYARATAMLALICICDLHHSSQQHQVLNPLSEATSSWLLVGFITAELQWELLLVQIFCAYVCWVVFYYWVVRDTKDHLLYDWI